jgi:predicted Zn finger-like uncharacterized protein
MLTILCPQCSAAYQVPSEKLGPQGRKLKCAKCGHVWLAIGPQGGEPVSNTAPTPPADPAPEPVKNAHESKDINKAASPEQKPPAAATTPPEPELAPSAPEIPLTAIARPSWKAHLESEQKWMTLAYVLAGLGLMGAIAVVALQLGVKWPVLEHKPEHASKTETLKRSQAVATARPAVVSSDIIMFNVTSTQSISGTEPILGIRGQVGNKGQAIVKLPTLRVELLNTSGKIVDFWPATLVTTTLPPQTSIPFDVTFTNPTGQAFRVVWVE